MSEPGEPWLRLLGPLPAEGVVRSAPVGHGEQARDPMSPIHGWNGLTFEIGTGPKNYRIVHVLVDAEGSLLSGSDHVVFRSETSSGTAGEIEQFNIGGRFEIDGTFNGTWWHIQGPELAGDEQPNWTYTSRKPSSEEITTFRQLIDDVLERGGIHPRR